MNTWSENATFQINLRVLWTEVC